MRILPMNYSTVNQSNQNYKSATQKAPAFNGYINVIAENLEKELPEFQVATNIVRSSIKILDGKATEKDLSVDGRGFYAFQFDKSFDKKARKIVSELKDNFSLMKFNTKVEFNEIK